MACKYRARILGRTELTMELTHSRPRPETVPSHVIPAISVRTAAIPITTFATSQLSITYGKFRLVEAGRTSIVAWLVNYLKASSLQVSPLYRRAILLKFAAAWIVNAQVFHHGLVWLEIPMHKLRI